MVFLTSGAVLVLEILATRLMAPYVGVTLETYTAIIGTMLAGISVGTWVGGYLADRIDPRRLLGPLLAIGGALAIASVPAVRLAGEQFGGGGGVSVVVVAMAAFLAPSAVLSAVSPTIVKLQLRDLGSTGRVVGRLSALGTAGAIAGTFLAGFVLIELAPTSWTVVGIGIGFTVAGLVVSVWMARRVRLPVVAALLLGVSSLAAAAATAEACEVETAYHCVRIEHDGLRPGGRLLVLDTLHHSYVDLDDPTYLEFRYVRAFADVVHALAQSGPIDALHVGGGGFTFPRWVSAMRPGSTNLVFEVDPGLVKVAKDRLGLDPQRQGVDIRVGDARKLLSDLSPSGFDFVVGDAFGNLAVPWHLTTREFVTDVRSALRPGGIYVLNVIDLPPMRFARAEVATLFSTFDHVAMVVPPAYAQGTAGGNIVLVASGEPLDIEALTRTVGGIDGEVVVSGDRLQAFAAGAPVLTDDHAPVDQWLARTPLQG